VLRLSRYRITSCFNTSCIRLCALPSSSDDLHKPSIVHTETTVLTIMHLNVFRSYLTCPTPLPFLLSSRSF
jgi:hypothetical protein